MKRLIFFGLACVGVLALTGCQFNETVPESTVQHDKATLTTTHNDLPESSATAAATETSSTLPSVQDPATEPIESEAAPPQRIVRPEPMDDEFVKVRTYIPDVIVELRYSTDDNFTNQRIYDFTEVWLRYGTVKKLLLVQEELKQNGLRLKIWDGFRPPSAQFKLWHVCPDPTYVSNPNNGFSSHSRGNTVDITLTYADGTELVMPTGFDDFSKLADRDYSDCSEAAAENALLLEELMEEFGFKPYSGEWWHFSDTQSYPVDEVFEPTEATTYYADCNEFISLRTNPTTTSEVITKISVGEQFQVLAKHGDFALIEYNDVWGYVLCSYIQPVG